MQNPTDQAGTSIPAVTVREGPRLNPMGTFTLRLKAARRSESWYQKVAAPLSIPARKKQRREEPNPTTTTDEATTKNRSHAATVAHPPTDAATDHAATDAATDHADSYPVMDMHSIARTTAAPRRARHWTPEEDAKLTSVITNTPKKKRGKEYKTDWVAIALLNPGRTRNQCQKRWNDVLDPSINLANGGWTEDRDTKLKEAVQKHGCKKWAKIAALVPGRTRSQCQKRWRNVLNPSIDHMTRRTGRWAKDEDIKLKEAVQKHGSKDWAVIAALVPGRTGAQCHKRWNNALNPSVDWVNGRTGQWKEDEDTKLKNAIHEHGDKDWATLAALVPGRTRNQCQNRWHDALDPDQTGRTGKWVEDEDIELKEAVHKYGGKNWGAVAELVSGRTRSQCKNRWHNVLDPSIAKANGRTGTWTADEASKLNEAVQKYGGKDCRNWVAVAALVPGRTNNQCLKRWTQIQKKKTRHKKAPASGQHPESP
jgi:hypothetical protein